jgi:PKD repeat protein
MKISTTLKSIGIPVTGILTFVVILSFMLNAREAGVAGNGGGEAPTVMSYACVCGEGSGDESDASVPLIHFLLPGESLRSLAKEYGVSVFSIASCNRITDIRTLRPGDPIVIPRLFNEGASAGSGGKNSNEALRITVSAKSGSVPFRVGFSSTGSVRDGFSTFVWDFGCGRFSYERETEFTYLRPGKYTVTCAIRSAAGDEISSGPVEITARDVYGDIGELDLVTLDRVNELFDLSGRVFGPYGREIVFDRDTKVVSDPVIVAMAGPNLLRAIAPGYAIVTLDDGDHRYTFDLFVPPFPTQHTIEPESDWYKTQFDTGLWGNCGPACVAMAVHWATGEPITVEESREEIGMPYASGALSYANMLDNFTLHGIEAYRQTAPAFEDMSAIIDEGKLIVISFNTTTLRPVEGDKRTVFTDRYYPDTTGHYIVIKGYTLDERFFVAYDPIPGDWKKNLPRYSDGISMLGRNRYFRTEEIMSSIKANEVLVICKK